jgi:hypothetical protein
MASDHTKNRRRLLKALAGAGGVYTTAKIVPETWSKPVVDALSLPAHALTSVTYFGTVNLGQIVAELSPPAGDPILDLIAPTADAQPPSVIAYICVTPSGSSAMVMVQFQNLVVPDAGVLYSGMVPVGGAPTNLSDVEGPQGCPLKKMSCSCRLDSLGDHADGRIVLDLDSIHFNISIPSAACEIPDLGGCDFEDSTDNANGP